MADSNPFLAFEMAFPSILPNRRVDRETSIAEDRILLGMSARGVLQAAVDLHDWSQSPVCDIEVPLIRGARLHSKDEYRSILVRLAMDRAAIQESRRCE